MKLSNIKAQTLLLVAAILIIPQLVLAERFIIGDLPKLNHELTLGAQSTDTDSTKGAVAQGLSIEKSAISEVLSVESEPKFAVVDISIEEASALENQGMSVTKDETIKAFFSPNDFYYQPYNGVRPQRHLDRIRMPAAWDTTRGLESQVVAVLDTGAWLQHPDLQGRFWTNSGEISGNGIDDDANGFIDDVNGVDLVNNDGNPNDDNVDSTGNPSGHGTHVSGIIGAKLNNTTGMAGMTQSKIMAVKVLGANGSGLVSDLLRGLVYVIDQASKGTSVKAINLSLGWQSSTEPTAIKDACEIAGMYGIVVVAAAGNESISNDTNNVYPANFSESLDNVISVASINETGALSSFSNYGSSVTIAAPGDDTYWGGIYSTVPGHRYNGTTYNYFPYRGTSMAAPHVSGAITLMSARRPDLNARGLKKALLDGGRINSALQGKTKLSRELDVMSAILEAQNATNLWKVRGTVLYNGSPLPGVLINSTLGALETNDSGKYEIANVVHGSSLSVEPSIEGYVFDPARRSGTVTGDSRADFNASIATFTISGSVTVDGAPLSGVTISDATLGQTVTDQNGAYQFSGVQYGTDVRLSATKEGYTFDPAFRIGRVVSNSVGHFVGTKIVTPTNVTPTVRSFDIGFRFRFKQGNSPISGVKVTMVSDSTGIKSTGITGKTGSMKLKGVKEGVYTLKVQKKGFKIKPNTFKLNVNGNKLIRFTITRK